MFKTRSTSPPKSACPGVSIMLIFCTVVIDGYVFRKNGYTSFTLQVVVIQNQFTVGLVVAEQVSRQHHLVHQSCFSVVNVSNNGNVSNVLHTIPIYNCVQNYCFSAKGGYFMQGFYIFGGNWTADAGLHGEETSVRAFKEFFFRVWKKM